MSCSRCKWNQLNHMTRFCIFNANFCCSKLAYSSICQNTNLCAFWRHFHCSLCANSNNFPGILFPSKICTWKLKFPRKEAKHYTLWRTSAEHRKLALGNWSSHLRMSSLFGRRQWMSRQNLARRRSKRTSVCEMLLKAAAPALIIVRRRSARFGGHQFPMAQLSHVAPQSHIFTSYKLHSCCREREGRCVPFQPHKIFVVNTQWTMGTGDGQSIPMGLSARCSFSSNRACKVPKFHGRRWMDDGKWHAS